MINEKKKILFVDPDLDLLEECKLLFESRDYNVSTAEDIEEGWKLFLSEKPDAAVVGLIMEEYDKGFVLCHRIKKIAGEKISRCFFLLRQHTQQALSSALLHLKKKNGLNAMKL
jgi:DNA-binding response OmpR family regulator